MKLKKAKKIAKKLGAKYIAVDANLDIFTHNTKPIIDKYDVDWISNDTMEYLGQYTGSKGWRDTLRRIK